MKNVAYKYEYEDVARIVRMSKSYAGVLREFGIRPTGGNYRILKRFISDHNINVSHFTGQGWNVGLGFKPNKMISDGEVFVKDSKYRCSWRLRERYKKLMNKNSCDNCGLSVWMGDAIPLEIHHINGNNTDNRLQNLQLLCPNCHARTDNYRGRAHLSALSEKRDVECRKFKEALTGRADGNLEPSSSKRGKGAETRHDTPKDKLSMVKE